MHASDDAMIRRPSPHRLTLGCDGARPLVVISTASRDCCKEKQCDRYNQNTHSSKMRLNKESKGQAARSQRAVVRKWCITVSLSRRVCFVLCLDSFKGKG
jgi:hypothetical protein